MINLLYRFFKLPHCDNLINLVGVQRCGTHAVSNWLLRQYPNICNDAQLESCNSYYKIENFYIRNVLYNGSPNTINYIGHSNNVVICHENVNLADFNQLPDNTFWSIGRPLKTKNVLLLRDFYNFTASFFKRHEYVPEHIISCWKSIAEEVLAKKRKFKYFINYNLWHTNMGYRREIAKVLGLEFTDHGKESILDFGGGSSFDGTLRDGRAHELDVEKRWTHFINSDGYRRIIRNNKHLTDMSDAIFGPVKGTECLWP